MAATTREKMIRTAHDIFYSEGFHAVGLDRIIGAVGVTKTTFYNHFASKDDLIIEALRWHDRWWQETFRRMLREHGGDAPRDQLLAIPDALDEMFSTDEFNGCIFVNVSAEFPRPHDPAHELAAAHKSSMEDILQELAGYAGAADAPGLAQELAMIMEGAYVTRQVSGRRDVGQIARRLVGQAVARHLPRQDA